MDPFTQGITGALCAQTFSNRQQQKQAALTGFAGGIAADLDILIQSSNDPLLTLEYHRHFTHALIFIPVGGLLVALCCQIAYRLPTLWKKSDTHKQKTLNFGSLYLLATLGYATAGLLDACTSYGTHLLWPFSDSKIAWNIISVIDPAFTLFGLTALCIAVIYKKPYAALTGLIICSIYLSIGYVQHNRIQAALYKLAESRGETILRSEVKPTIGNLLVWRGIYQTENYFQIDAYRAGTSVQVYAGGRKPKLNSIHVHSQIPSNSVIATDIKRFTEFSAGYVVKMRDSPLTIGDIRYSMLPDSTEPLWGITVNTRQPDQHVEFSHFRQMPDGGREAFFNMLKGKPP